MSKVCSSSHVNATNKDYVCNPLTGIWIKIGGQVYKKLIKEGHINSNVNVNVNVNVNELKPNPPQVVVKSPIKFKTPISLKKDVIEPQRPPKPAKLIINQPIPVKPNVSVNPPPIPTKPKLNPELKNRCEYC